MARGMQNASIFNEKNEFFNKIDKAYRHSALLQPFINRVVLITGDNGDLSGKANPHGTLP